MRTNEAADPVALLRKLAGMDRRIDNMRFLMRFHGARREEALSELRGAIGRAEPRLAPIDFDARRDPRTDRWCVACQRDLRGPADELRLVLVGAAPHAMLLEDERLFDMGVLALPEGAADEGRALIGRDCARMLGGGWTRPERPKDNEL